jgi:hypothetical protein
MSNFYYKRSASEDELNRAGHDSLDPMHPEYNSIRKSRIKNSNSK